MDTELPIASARVLGAIYVVRFGMRDWWIVKVTNPRDHSVSPLAGPFKQRPEIAHDVRAVYGVTKQAMTNEQKRLEYLRQELRAERISYGEVLELQSLIPFIPAADVELLEAAGVPEWSIGVCPNCGQWQHARNGDCLNECKRRGFA